MRIQQDNLWVYTILPVVLLGVVGMLVYGAYYTFVIGLIAGFYYTRERTLVPLMITHVVLDLWSFGVFVV